MAEPIRELTEKETRWCQALNRLFARMPRTLVVVECADTVMVCDRDGVSQATDISNGQARNLGLVLYDVNSATCKVTSVSG